MNVLSAPIANGGLQPWNQVIFPPTDSNWPITPMTPSRARAIPAISRVIQLIGGMIKQMGMDDYAGDKALTRPRLLDQPDPEVARSWWIDVQTTDYLLHGNALHVITSRDAAGYPLTVTWLPAEWVSITWTTDRRGVEYWAGGTKLNPDNIIHVRRGADPWCPYRGVGLVEQHLTQLGRIDDQEKYEQSTLKGSAVPSVAVITPNPEVSQEEADAAKQQWVMKYGGPVREPAVLPAGTQVIPLAWSPADAQMVEARKLSLLDVANMANLDGYWVGAPASSLTYRSPGPMYLNLLRQTINPIIEDFEGTFSSAWLPRGRKVRFDRQAVLKDDMQTMVSTLANAVSAKLITQSEARVYLGYSKDVPEELQSQPIPEALLAAQQPADQPADDQGNNDGEQDQS